MTTTKAIALELIAGQVEAVIEGDDEDAIARLVETHSGQMGFSAGTHKIQMGGVTGTGTAGYRAALESWLRLANKKLGDVRYG